MLAKWRRTPDPRPCERCGETIENPYKGDVKFHRECRDEARRENERVRIPADDPQMERLFRDYEARPSLTIDSREDGTRVMVVSDLQLPFVDEPLYKAMLAFADDFRPHDFIWNGDILDCYEISDFDKNPRRAFGIDTEIEMAKSALYDVSKRLSLDDGKQWFIMGNHEQRLERYIARHAPAIDGLVKSLDEALELDEMCAGWVPYGKHIDYLGMIFTHGNFVSQFSAYTARKHADRYRSSGANGHTHRMGSYSYRDGASRSHTWYEMGCLCRLDLEYTRGIPNWQQGFLVGTVHRGALHVSEVRVIETDEGRGFDYGGRYYEID